MGKINALFLALALLSGVLAAALSVDTYTVTPSTLRPGEEGAVTFSVKNVLPSSATSTIDPLEDVQVFFGATTAGIEFKAKSPFVIGTIDSGGSALVSVPFRVLDTAKGGVLSTSFFISQKDKTDLKSVNAIISVVNPPILSLSSDKQTVLGTDSFNLSIVNNGGKASKVSLKLQDGSDFSFLGMSEIYLGGISETASVMVPLDSRSAEEGINSVPFVLSYQQEGGDIANETKHLTLAVKKEKADLVFTQMDTVVTSRDNLLVLKVKNTGRTLEDVKFYLEDEKIKAKESKLVRLGNLAEGQEKELALLVFADSQPGVRNADITLKWVEDDVEKEEDTALQIFVNSDADAAIFVDAKPAPIVVGGEHTLSVLVSNVGSYKIQNVEVAIPESELFEILNAQKSQYIGGLESDDFSTVQYKVRVKVRDPGTYPLEVQVRYKDQSGVWINKNSTAQLIIRPASDAAGAKAGNGDGLLLFGGLVLLAGAGAYYWFRMRKPKAK